jgi:hypothetical protein
MAKSLEQNHTRCSVAGVRSERKANAESQLSFRSRPFFDWAWTVSSVEHCLEDMENPMTENENEYDTYNGFDESVHTVKPVIYLASPYTSPIFSVRALRYRLVTAAAATLIRRGMIVFSPITMSHATDVVLGGTAPSDFWRDFNERLLAASDTMYVLKLERWDQSQGIQRELNWCNDNAKPVKFMLESEIDSDLLTRALQQLK